jgi:hypothetical protein
MEQPPAEERTPGSWSAADREQVSYVQLVKNYFWLFAISIFIAGISWGIIKLQQLVPWDDHESGRPATDSQPHEFNNLVLTVFLSATAIFVLPFYTLIRFLATKGRDAAKKGLIYSILVWVMIGLAVYFALLWAFGWLLVVDIVRLNTQVFHIGSITSISLRQLSRTPFVHMPSDTFHRSWTKIINILSRF